MRGLWIFALLVSVIAGIVFTSGLKDKKDNSDLNLDREVVDVIPKVDTVESTSNADYVHNSDDYIPEYSWSKVRDYAHYDDSALEDLAESGDLIAIGEIVTRAREVVSKIEKPFSDEDYHALSENFNRMRQYADLSVTLGSNEYISTAFSQYEGVNFEGADISRENLLNQLSYLEFASLRGVPGLKYMHADIEMNMYEHVYGDFTLTDSDRQYIYSQAKVIFDDYNKKRAKLGYPPLEIVEDVEIDEVGFTLFAESAGENIY
ncbi:hypothetical protein QWI17_12205 [Gilvimarinus sp. SDUM040013]|uniref:Uncharacterized protein n=1 Tax=Gilvimarinus gilvus TaxID=3058038 RepID=A0ABU4RYD5_9GAMM|nr:hypothetical protein [Gilvimarinus sp. SDUM040013]MDO3386600.1 hypothetical protein [Gilvimarinus sp. SDUM040013]MDX6849176.1 hypothetical protein [Gilvimarinus sp. SDUM040013]